MREEAGEGNEVTGQKWREPRWGIHVDKKLGDGGRFGHGRRAVKAWQGWDVPPALVGAGWAGWHKAHCRLLLVHRWLHRILCINFPRLLS